MERVGSAYLPAKEWHRTYTALTQARSKFQHGAEAAVGGTAERSAPTSLDVVAKADKGIVKKHRRALLKQTLAELEELRKSLSTSSLSQDANTVDEDDDGTEDDDDDEDLKDEN
jgi:hypothetical protein